MIVGVSRVKQFKACARQWWFGEVAEVKLGHSYGQVFGNVLHACVERWLKEQEPYPPGWQWCPESRMRVDRGDDDLIQSMVDKAIVAGFLRRHPDRKVEHTWWEVLTKSPTETFRFCVVAKGTIDLCEPGVIVDHKGSKNVSRYAKTKEELRQDLQLLVYLFVNENQRGIAHSPEDVLTVGHINYCRSSGEVTEKTVQVKWKQAEDAWTDFTNTALRMLPLAGEIDFTKVPGALDEPAREDGNRTCQDYGGCGYLPICSAGGPRGDKEPERAFIARKFRAQHGEFERFKTRSLRASLPPQAREDFQRSIEEMATQKVNTAAAAKQGKKVQPVAAKPRNPFQDQEVEEVEEAEPEEEPAPPRRVVKKAPAPPPDEEAEPEAEPEAEAEPEEEPAPPPRAPRAPARKPAQAAAASLTTAALIASKPIGINEFRKKVVALDESTKDDLLVTIYGTICGHMFPPKGE